MSRRIRGSRALGAVLFAAAVALGAPPPASAGALEVSVRDAAGAPVEDAVVVAVPAAGVPAPKGDRPRDVIDQIDKEFVPEVKVIRVGTTVSFPNKDNIRHHVYSFSPAKKFELPLYKSIPADPVTFDRPGLVILGCNIHDWMIAWVYVVESPWFGRTGKEGSLRILDLPSGEYEIEVYHPRAKDATEPVRRRLSLGAGGSESLAFQIPLKAAVRRPRAPRAGDTEYR